jgi:YkoP-like protein
MPGGVAAAGGGSPAKWRDEVWAGSVGWFDTILRTYHGIHEFAEDPACVLRLGLSQARAAVALADGTQILPGDLIGTLHLWNERLPRYSSGGPDLAWACEMRDRVASSLGALAEYVDSEPGWREVTAFRADAALSSRLGEAQLQRVARRYGFEPVPQRPSWLGRLYALGDSVTLWGLARAYNPAAVPRQPFLRERCELWISRVALLARYAGRGARSAIHPPSTIAASMPASAAAIFGPSSTRTRETSM